MARSLPIQIGLRVSEGMREALERAAAQSGRSMNGEIVRRLERSFERGGQALDATVVGSALFDLQGRLSAVQEALVKNDQAAANLTLLAVQEAVRRLAMQVFVADAAERAEIPGAVQDLEIAR